MVSQGQLKMLKQNQDNGKEKNLEEVDEKQ